MFYFNDFLERLEIDPANVRLLRHDPIGLAAWRRGGPNALGCFASFQKTESSPYAGTQLACHFLPGPMLANGTSTALFVGMTRIQDRWPWDGQRLPAIVDEEIIGTERNRQGLEAFDLEWLTRGHEYSERILIDWGAGTRAWSQWAGRHDKSILEVRLQAQEPSFPGFSKFKARISEIPSFPRSWVSALESVGGIYLLVADNGDQYVGSASGADGFMGRWRTYLANGHGGNVILRKEAHRDYFVSILETASPEMSLADILAREALWKDKLGVRAHGLNAN